MTKALTKALLSCKAVNADTVPVKSYGQDDLDSKSIVVEVSQSIPTCVGFVQIQYHCRQYSNWIRFLSSLFLLKS